MRKTLLSLLQSVKIPQRKNTSCFVLFLKTYQSLLQNFMVNVMMLIHMGILAVSYDVC